MERIVLETDLLEEMQKEVDSGAVIRLPGGFVKRNPDYQPKRSKREDSLIRKLLEDSAMDFRELDNDPPYPLVWDKDGHFIGHKVIEEMRCSEQSGN